MNLAVKQEEAPGSVAAAADAHLAYLREHVHAREANHVVCVVWALASYFAQTVPTFARLCFASSLPVSGKSTAAALVAEVANFSDLGRRSEKMSRSALMRVANETKQGVKIEDVHRFGLEDDIFSLMVNSFPRDGVMTLADPKNMLRVVTYEIGGVPIIFTTNDAKKLDADVRRRTIVLPMMRAEPHARVKGADREELLRPIRETFAAAAGEVGQAALREAGVRGFDYPAWMDELQYDRWRALFVVASVFLGEVWWVRLAKAAEEIESVASPAEGLHRLLQDIKAIRVHYPKTKGILPERLYDLLRNEDPERWGDYTATRFGRMLGAVQLSDGRSLEKEYILAEDRGLVLGARASARTRCYYWRSFEPVWKAYGI